MACCEFVAANLEFARLFALNEKQKQQKPHRLAITGWMKTTACPDGRLLYRHSSPWPVAGLVFF